MAFWLVGQGLKGSDPLSLIDCDKSYALSRLRARSLYTFQSEKRDRSMSDRSRFHTLQGSMRQRATYARNGEAYLARAHVQRIMTPQACSFVFPGGGLVDPLLRASNETLPRARVPRAGGRLGRLPLLFQSAEEGVPRKAQEREAARFLSPDCRGSNETNNLHRCIALNSSKR